MKKLFAVLIACWAPWAIAQITADSAVPLWPNNPAVTGTHETEFEYKHPNEPEQRLLTNVTVPTVQIFHPAAKNDKHFAMLILPGGGFGALSMHLEGEAACAWINSLGGTAALVKYRVPSPPESTKGQTALKDARRALSIVRDQLISSKIPFNRIGVIGFSAGGKLAAWMSSGQVADRPAFVVLVYPAYLGTSGKPGGLADGIHLDSITPSTILFQASDDRKFIDGTLAYFGVLRANGISAELHVFAEGGHGFGLGSPDRPVGQWPMLATSWLSNIGILRLPTKK